MSGDELGRKGKAGKTLYDGLERSELSVRVLIPTPAQLAAGIRLIDAEPETWPQAVRDTVRRAETAGWRWRVTRSHFLDIPPTTGWSKGEWVDTHSLAVRLGKQLAGRAWGVWHGTERGWRYDSGQFWGHFMQRPVNVNATQLTGLILGRMHVQYDQKEGKYHVLEKMDK